MTTGNMIERSVYTSSGSFKKSLFRSELRLNMRVIVVDAQTNNVLAEGWITELGEMRMTLRTPQGTFVSNTYEVWGFASSVESRETNIAYQFNPIFTMRSTRWLRWKFRNK
jgi:hypothetical protein